MIERADQQPKPLRPAIARLYGADPWCGESAMFRVEKPPVRWLLSWSGNWFFAYLSDKLWRICIANAMGTARELVLAASYSRFAPEPSPRLNECFELLVNPALLDFRPKFERAIGNTLSRGGHSRR
jgi:hypothetical protein